MPSEKLKSIHAALGEFLGKVRAADAERLRLIRRNLEAAADQVENLENNLCVKEME